MGKSAEVDAWFRDLEHPLKDEMLEVRKIILLPSKYPHLEGGGDTVRYMRFADGAEVTKKRADLEAAVRAWCSLKEGSGPRLRR